MYTFRRVGLPRRTSVSSLGITEKLLKEDKVRGKENLLKIEDQPYLRFYCVKPAIFVILILTNS